MHQDFVIFIRVRWINLLVIKEAHHGKKMWIERTSSMSSLYVYPWDKDWVIRDIWCPQDVYIIIYILCSDVVFIHISFCIITRRVRHIAINDENIRKLSDEIVILCVQSWIKVFHYILYIHIPYIHIYIFLFVHIALLSLFVPFILLYTFNISLDYDADKFLFKYYIIIIYPFGSCQIVWTTTKCFLWPSVYLSLYWERQTAWGVSCPSTLYKARFMTAVFMLRCPELSHKRVIEFNALPSLYFIVAFVCVDWLAWKSLSCVLVLWSAISLNTLSRITFLHSKCRT